MRSLIFFNWPNPSSHTMVLKLTQSLTEITRHWLWRTEHGWRVRPTASPSACRLSEECGLLDILQPYSPTRPLTGTALLFFLLLLICNTLTSMLPFGKYVKACPQFQYSVALCCLCEMDRALNALLWFQVRCHAKIPWTAPGWTWLATRVKTRVVYATRALIQASSPAEVR
jgi:hypothetical protein